MDTDKERKILHKLRGPTQEYVWLNDTLSRALDEIDRLNAENEMYQMMVHDIKPEMIPYIQELKKKAGIDTT